MARSHPHNAGSATRIRGKRSMGIFGTGQALRRREDARFLTGTGRYTDDITLEGQACLYLFRSPYAHGRITRLDVEDATQAPGVIAVLTSADLEAGGVRDIPGADMPPSSLTPARPARKQPPLARERVRYVGEPVAGIVAESIAAAKDAAELIVFEIEEFPVAVTPTDALREGAPLVHDEVAGNRFGTLEHGDRDATEKAFANAAHVVDVEIINNRLAPTAMEPRGCIASFDAPSGEMTVYLGCQSVHALRDRILACVDLDADKLRVICPDVGGAFGLKFFLQCETVVAVYAAKLIGRPVKWIGERGESFLSDLHGRDHASRASLALDDDGRFLALRASIVGNAGAYCSQVGPIIPWFGAFMSTGCYDIPVAYVDVTMAFTNTVPVDAYRGAGRPEAAYLIERLVDAAARKLGIPRDEIRRRNFIRPAQFPYRTVTGQAYDSGDYARLMDLALARAGWADFETRRAISAARGRLRGIGLSYYVEICSAMGSEDTHIRFEPDGRVTVLIGTQASGQGHETSFAQMVAAGLGVPIDDIDIVQGDTKLVPTGQGTGGSRSMAIGGSALYRTVEAVIDRGRRMAAELLEAAEVDIEFGQGVFRVVGTDRSTTIAEVARSTYAGRPLPEGVEAGLRTNREFTPEAGTFPNGCHVCEVEIDPETGTLEILRYTVEDDVGTVVNPLILEGQIMGGVAQGLGQACGEYAIYDPDSGQLLTASFTDYSMPRADWVPGIDFRFQEVPSPRNPLGIKGAGEAGTVGAAPALVSAVLDALAPRGIRHVDMPVTPHTLWQALEA
ncbi:MAG: xanthine dehydrogenase family protein molybdopterin-binding subunit [Gammaproteobacteria bacterium]|nr:xanthine dehydrogenase family protein molybdopterin-binding subunit [Gammaproteobacteria bacterium]